jgi:dihydroflavonol-4-reductase
MKVLVLGSTGFIGSRLCRELLERGHHVKAFHRPTSSLRLLEGLAVAHVLGDLTQPETIEAAMDGVETVYHTAATMVGGSDQSGKLYTITVEGTRSVVQAALRKGVRRLLYTSSVAALGVPERVVASNKPATAGLNPGAGICMNESHTWNLRPDFWPYGYSKYLAELEVQKAVAQGLDALIVNPSSVIGAGDIYRQNISMVVQFSRQRFPALVEGGLNFVHIADVVEGHLAAMERGRTGERYILGGENMSFVSLAKLVSGIAGVPAPALVLPGGLVRALSGLLMLLQSFIDLPINASNFPLAGNYFYYDTRKAQVELGLSSPRPVRDAVQEAYDWFLHVGAIRRSRSSPG